MTTGTRATIPCPFCTTMNSVELEPAAQRPTCDECGRPFLLDRPIKVTDQTMEETIRTSEVPVVVDFYADWCAPCRMMAPMLDQLAADLQGELMVAKLDTDSNPTMAIKYGIRGIPTLIVFRDGREWKRQTGVLPPDRLAELLEIEVEVEED
jgi:thioredoxin 2